MPATINVVRNFILSYLPQLFISSEQDFILVRKSSEEEFVQLFSTISLSSSSRSQEFSNLNCIQNLLATSSWRRNKIGEWSYLEEKALTRLKLGKRSIHSNVARALPVLQCHLAYPSYVPMCIYNHLLEDHEGYRKKLLHGIHGWANLDGHFCQAYRHWRQDH